MVAISAATYCADTLGLAPFYEPRPCQDGKNNGFVVELFERRD